MEALYSAIMLAEDASRQQQQPPLLTITIRQKPFRSRFTFEQRSEMARSLMQSEPTSDRIPVILERAQKSTTLHVVAKAKYAVPKMCTLGEYMCDIRRRVKLQPEEAMFLFVNCNGTYSLPPLSHTMVQIYAKHKSDDGLLYFEYAAENTFGACLNLEQKQLDIRNTIHRHALVKDIQYEEIAKPTRDWPFPLRRIVKGWCMYKIDDSHDRPLYDYIVAEQSHVSPLMSLFRARFEILSKET